ncbi:MAG: hypothetical protein ACRDPZ_11255 [Gaiellaceae bacterium]
MIVMVTAAFVLAVPAAWGKGQPVDQSQGSNLAQTDAHEGAAIGRDQMVPVDACVGAVATTRVISGDDHVRIDPSDLPVSVPATSSGRELEWPQVGVGLGLGLGLALALGLFLTVRYTRARPLAL